MQKADIMELLRFIYKSRNESTYSLKYLRIHDYSLRYTFSQQIFMEIL